jgi:hypothetical protein
MFLVNATMRVIESMSREKKVVEDRVTGLLEEAFEHLGYLFCIDASSKLTREWTDEIEDKYIVPAWHKIQKVKHLKSKEIRKWVAECTPDFAGAAQKAFNDKEYSEIPRRYSSKAETVSKARAVNLQPVVDLFSAALTSKSEWPDAHTDVQKAVDYVISQIH